MVSPEEKRAEYENSLKGTSGLRATRPKFQPEFPPQLLGSPGPLPTVLTVTPERGTDPARVRRRCPELQVEGVRTPAATLRTHCTCLAPSSLSLLHLSFATEPHSHLHVPHHSFIPDLAHTHASTADCPFRTWRSVYSRSKAHTDCQLLCGQK